MATCSLTSKISAALLQTSLFSVHISEGLAVNPHNKNIFFCVCMWFYFLLLFHPGQKKLQQASHTTPPLQLFDRSEECFGHYK